MDAALEIVVGRCGTARMVYDETFDAHCLGPPNIRRGSDVEPTADGQWTADLSRVGGPRLGPFALRSEALAAEVTWLRRHWLVRDDSVFPSQPTPGDPP